jgi:hypothetical protein
MRLVFLVRFAKAVIVALLALELAGYAIGFMLSGALGEASDANGPILLLSPLSNFVSLLAVRRFGSRVSTWILALAVLSSPFWNAVLVGPASARYLWPFWANAIVILTWPVWGLLPCRSMNRSMPATPD